MTPGLNDGKSGWRAFPFVTRGLPRGIFAVQVTSWDEEIHRALGLRYLQSLEKYFENSLLHKRVFDMSVRDGLTGLYNVRVFKERVDQELKVAERIQHPFCLVFFDVDKFKNYNDTHGHQAGDNILRTFADLLTKNFRSTDFVARYGGEEFCVLMPHTQLQSALTKVESFRQVVENFPFPNGESQPLGKITVSAGVAEFPTHASSYERLIGLADQALYQAKDQSRNCVVSARPDPAYFPPFESRHVTVGR